MTNIEISQLGILGVSATYKRSRNEYYQTNRCAVHIFTSLPTAQVQIYQILCQTRCYNVVTTAAGPCNIGKEGTPGFRLKADPKLRF